MNAPQQCQTPLEELLRGVPIETRLEIPMEGITGTHMIPVGKHCHDAANIIEGHTKALNRVVRALRFIYDETEGYADGAVDASPHDKMCSYISGLAMRALDLQIPDPVASLLKGLQDVVRAGCYRRGEAVAIFYDYEDGFFISRIGTDHPHHPLLDLDGGARRATLGEAIFAAVEWHNAYAMQFPYSRQIKTPLAPIWERDNESTHDLLKMIHEDVPVEIIAAWTDEQCLGADKYAMATYLQDSLIPPRPEVLGPAKPRFGNVSCSQCGRDFGPGDHGYSHCSNHASKMPLP